MPKRSIAKLDWQELLQQFLFFKRAVGRSELTLRDYEYHITHFFKLYPNCFHDEQQLKKCLLEQLSQSVKPATYNLRLTYLKTFFKWCVEENINKSNPLEGILKKKAEERIVKIDTEILKKLLELPDKNTFCGIRDYALMLLTLDTGIRPKEAFSLLIEHF